MRDSPLAPGDMQPWDAPRRKRPSGAQRSKYPWGIGWRWCEALLLTAAVPGVRFAAGSADPFGLAEAFPWLVFVPFAIGLQHGLGCAIASVLALVGAAVGYASWAGASLPPASVAFACGAIALVASRACDAQRERCERLRVRVAQLELATERERRARDVLRLSHDRLAEQLIGAPSSLQEASSSYGERVAAASGVHEFGRLVLDVLAQYAELQEGSVWLGSEGSLVSVATTRGGESAPPRVMQLAERAMETQSAQPVLDDGVPDAGSDGEAALAALPLRAAGGAVRGAVVVEQLSNEGLMREALTRMDVLVSGVIASVQSETWDRWIEESMRRKSSGRRSTRKNGARAWDAIA